MHYPDDLNMIAMQYGLKMQFNLDSDGSNVICMHLVKVLQNVYGDARQSHTLPSAIALPVHAFHTLQQQSEREYFSNITGNWFSNITGNWPLTLANNAAAA